MAGKAFFFSSLVDLRSRTFWISILFFWAFQLSSKDHQPSNYFLANQCASVTTQFTGHIATSVVGYECCRLRVLRVFITSIKMNETLTSKWGPPFLSDPRVLVAFGGHTRVRIGVGGYGSGGWCSYEPYAYERALGWQRPSGSTAPTSANSST